MTTWLYLYTVKQARMLRVIVELLPNHIHRNFILNQTPSQPIVPFIRDGHIYNMRFESGLGFVDWVEGEMRRQISELAREYGIEL